jgi:hypothetical protein
MKPFSGEVRYLVVNAKGERGSNIALTGEDAQAMLDNFKRCGLKGYYIVELKVVHAK